MLFQPVFLLLAAASMASAVTVFAPDKCIKSNAESASSWKSCVEPVTSVSTCTNPVRDRDCICSAFAVQSSCYSKYCPGLFTNSEAASRFCTDGKSAVPATATPVSKPAEKTESSSSSPTTSSKAETANSGTKTTTPNETLAPATSTPSSSSSTAKPNAAPRAVGGSVGGLLAIVAALLA